jgi:hypothetical protein
MPHAVQPRVSACTASNLVMSKCLGLQAGPRLQVELRAARRGGHRSRRGLLRRPVLPGASRWAPLQSSGMITCHVLTRVCAGHLPHLCGDHPGARQHPDGRHIQVRRVRHSANQSHALCCCSVSAHGTTAASLLLRAEDLAAMVTTSGTQPFLVLPYPNTLCPNLIPAVCGPGQGRPHDPGVGALQRAALRGRLLRQHPAGLGGELGRVPQVARPAPPAHHRR